MIGRFATFGIIAALAASLAASAAESKQSMIDRAMSAGPSTISRAATVIDMGKNGKPIVLRAGSNGWTCYAGHPGVVGDDAFCADAAAMQWGDDWMAHKPKPTNTVPGIMYMLRGGTDWSATNPWATKGTPIHEPPHWMIMYPVAASSGLPTKMKNDGTWIMWAGTPYAHLMINQHP